MSRRLGWTKAQDGELLRRRDGGASWAEISHNLLRSHCACSNRYLLLKQQMEPKVEDNELVDRTIRYLQGKGFIVYPSEDKYMVGTRRMSERDMIKTAARIKRNMELLDG